MSFFFSFVGTCFAGAAAGVVIALSVLEVRSLSPEPSTALRPTPEPSMSTVVRPSSVSARLGRSFDFADGSFAGSAVDRYAVVDAGREGLGVSAGSAAAATTAATAGAAATTGSGATGSGVSVGPAVAPKTGTPADAATVRPLGCGAAFGAAWGAVFGAVFGRAFGAGAGANFATVTGTGADAGWRGARASRSAPERVGWQRRP